MKAPAEDQQKLLQLQVLDRDIARATYQRDHLPQITAIQELTARAKDLHRAGVKAAAQLQDQRRTAKVTEDDMRRVQARMEIQRGRLAAGQGRAKELSAIQHEVDKLVEREKELRERFKKEHEQVERTERIVHSVKTQGQGLLSDIRDLEIRKTRDVQTYNARIQGLQTERAEIAEQIDPNLLAEYDYLRERSGGIAVVGVRGRTVLESQLQLSAVDWRRIAAAAPDDVVVSDDHDIIIVRVGE